MSTWLKLLPLELDGINKLEYIEPDHPSEKGDHSVGEMSDTTRQLYTLGILLEKDGRQHQLDAHYCDDKTRKLELEAKAVEFLSKATIIRELMWIGIKDEFGLWGENIGVRRGFKVVIRPKEGGDIPPFIKRIMGLE